MPEVVGGMSGHLCGEGHLFKGLGERNLLLFAHHLGDGVPDDGTSFLDLLPGEAGCDANLQRSGNDLLGLKVILESLETGDKNTVGETLVRR
jgi:hypothetical protein